MRQRIQMRREAVTKYKAEDRPWPRLPSNSRKASQALQASTGKNCVDSKNLTKYWEQSPTQLVTACVQDSQGGVGTPSANRATGEACSGACVSLIILTQE